MQNLKKYKVLLQDTISYLQTLDDEYIEIKNIRFKTPSKKEKILSRTFKKEFIKDKPKTIETPKAVILPKIEITKSTNEIISPIKEKCEEAPKPSFSLHDAAKELTKENINIVKQNEEQILKPNEEVLVPQIVEESKKETKAQEVVLETKKIKLEDRPQIIEDNFSDIKSILLKLSKNLNLTDEILDDKLAKQKAQKYKLKNIAANLTILAYKENEKHYKFLEKLSIALNNYFYPSKVISAYAIEKENNWDTFLSENEIFLIISSDYTIFELPNLRKHYKENPTSKEKHLDNVPLFLLPDISLYLKEPSLKSSLFKTLQHKITSLKHA